MVLLFQWLHTAEDSVGAARFGCNLVNKEASDVYVKGLICKRQAELKLVQRTRVVDPPVVTSLLHNQKSSCILVGFYV